MKKVLLIFLYSLGFTAINLHGHNQGLELQILAFNDFHGNLEPPKGSQGKINGIDAGGIEYLSAHIKKLRQKSSHSITVSAGDLFGASPLLSALFNEKPTIEAMNELGLNINAIGNHEFDMGWQNLRELIGTSQAKENLAKFDFLAANVVLSKDRTHPFQQYRIENYDGLKVAFVGTLLKNASDVIMASSIEGLEFLDEADSVNALLPIFEELQVSAVVLLIHEGGFAPGDYDGCKGISGPIVDIAKRLDPKVSVVLSGHTHQAYNCIIDNKIVTSAASNGRVLTEVMLELDRQSGQVLKAKAHNKIVSRNIEKDLAQTQIIEKYQALAAPIANEIIGTISEGLTKKANQAGEFALGQVVADAQAQSLFSEEHLWPDFAMVNPGGIRTDINFISSDNNEGDGVVSFAELYAVQPFGNNLVSLDLTGGEIIEILEQQFAHEGKAKTHILQVSENFSYSYDPQKPHGEKIIHESIKIQNKAIVLEQNYRVVANNFLADGGDGFSGFKKGKNRIIGHRDIDALLFYFKKHSPVTKPLKPRISITTAN